MFKIFKWLGGRKNTDFIFSMIILTVALFTGFLSGSEFKFCFSAALGLTVASNAYKGYPPKR